MQTDILLLGDTSVSHPVTDELGLRTFAAAASDDAGAIDKAGLVIYDCRRAMTPELADPASPISKIVLSGKPVVLLTPSASDLSSLARLVGGAFQTPCVAAIVARHPDAAGPTAEHVALPYPSDVYVRLDETPPHGSSGGDMERPRAAGGPRPQPRQRDLATIAFVDRLRQYAVARGGLEKVGDMPDGLKYLNQSFSSTTGFTYSDADRGWDESNGPGAVSGKWTVWGFLDQPKGGTPSQFVSIESAYSLNAGSLYDDYDEGRGFCNLYLRTFNMSYDSRWKFLDQAPVNGENSWGKSVEVSVNYASPLGHYDVYKYDRSVNESIDSWSVRPELNGGVIGSYFFMNSPVDGSRINDTWTDAFNDITHKIKGFPAGARIGISPNAVAVRKSDTVLTDTQQFRLYGECHGAWFHSTNCFLGICGKWFWIGSLYMAVGPDVLVDFSHLQP